MTKTARPAGSTVCGFLVAVLLVLPIAQPLFAEEPIFE
jgi:hypothetical protein